MFPTVLYLQTRISFQQPKAEFFINFDLANRGGGEKSDIQTNIGK